MSEQRKTTSPTILFMNWMRDVVKSEYYCDDSQMELAVERLTLNTNTNAYTKQK